MPTEEDVIGLFNKTIDFSTRSLMQWNGAIVAILDKHENPSELTAAYTTLCCYLQQQPPCDKGSQDERKIKTIIAEMAKHPSPGLLIDAILLLKTSTPMLTDTVFPQLTFTLKTHKNPMAFAHAFMYFSNSSILNKEKNSCYPVNLKKVAATAEQWFSEPSLEPYFQQLSPTIFSQEIFDNLYTLSQEQPQPEINKFRVACELCLLSLYKEELFESMQLIEPFIINRINQLKKIPQELFQIPMTLSKAQQPCLVANAIVSTAKAIVFAEKTHEGSQNLGHLISNANLWFDDGELRELFQNMPLYQWSPTLMKSLVLASSSPTSSDPDPRFLVLFILSSSIYEAKEAEKNQAAYESFIAKEQVNLPAKPQRYSFYNNTNMPELVRSSNCIDTSLLSKNKICCQSEDVGVQEEIMAKERAHSIS